MVPNFKDKLWSLDSLIHIVLDNKMALGNILAKEGGLCYNQYLMLYITTCTGAEGGTQHILQHVMWLCHQPSPNNPLVTAKYPSLVVAINWSPCHTPARPSLWPMYPKTLGSPQAKSFSHLSSLQTVYPGLKIDGSQFCSLAPLRPHS